MRISTKPKRTKKYNLEISDSRQFPDYKQVSSLGKQIKLYGVINSLEEAKDFLGRYSPISPQELSINLVDGSLGEGTIKGTQIDIQLPAKAEAISQIKYSLEPSFGFITDDLSVILVLSIVTSIVLHEGLHGILDSTPNSKLAVDFERISKRQNTSGNVVTLLDEGITYAIQSYYAKEIKPIGSLTPRVSQQEEPNLKKRKALGEKIKPQIIVYMENGKSIDTAFLEFASRAMEEVEFM